MEEEKNTPRLFYVVLSRGSGHRFDTAEILTDTALSLCYSNS